MGHLTLKDKAYMKYMGYSHRGWFVNRRGVSFYKDFNSEAEMNRFVKEATEVGTKIIRFAIA